jgi:hypothetical protein
VAAFGLWAPYLANVSRDYTRYCLFWGVGDTLDCLLLVLGLASLFLAAAELARWTGQSLVRRCVDHAFLVVLGVGVLANAMFAAGHLTHNGLRGSSGPMIVAWIVLALIVGYSFGRPGRSLVWCGRQACRIAWPVVPLTFAVLLASSTYPEPVGSPSPRPTTCTTRPAGAEARPGVYIFLFDEWSYERTLGRSSFATRYPHLDEFAAGATLYTDAHAPGECTEASIPAILLQTSDRVVVSGRRIGFESQDGAFAPASARTSLFAAFDALGYHTALLGFTLPYHHWVGTGVDFCRTYCYYPRGESLISRLATQAFSAARYSPDPWSGRLYKRIETRQVHQVICGILEGIRRDAGTIMRDWPSDTVLFTHVHLPHMPAVLGADLRPRSPERTGWNDDDAAAYESNLAAMDALIGDFVSTLRRSGRYDGSVVVLTSDHGWRHDPDRLAGRSVAPLTRVPLLVKGPHQATAARVDGRFETCHLGRLLESLVRPDAGPGIIAMNAGTQ